MRNRVQHLPVWWQHLRALVEHVGDEAVFDLSVYENDSDDGSDRWLREHEDGFRTVFDHVSVVTERILTAYHGSVVDSDRVHNLAAARNRCIDSGRDLSAYESVVFVEPDVTYDCFDAGELLDADHDIRSGYTVDKADRFYDTWATRRTSSDTWWDGSIPASPTRVASTFNGFCVYRGSVIADGVRYSGHSPERGSFDCDTAVICESFRARGHDDIVIYPFRITHFG